MHRAFLIGNGESRVGFDLERLRPLGTIVGCNANFIEILHQMLSVPLTTV